MSQQSIKFSNKAGLAFITELKRNVNQYFSENEISRHANTKMVVKTISLLTLYLGAYAMMLTGLLPVWGLLIGAVVMGIGKAGIGFSIAHDAIHGSYSANKTTNRLLGLTMNLIGGCAYVWKTTHNKIHHTYTNIHEVDEDLDTTSMMRLSPEGPYKRFHRFQFIYFPFVYSLATLFWVFLKDYRKMMQDKIGPYPNDNHPPREVALVIGSKLFYYLYTIVIPLLVLPISWWQFVIGFLVMHLTAGMILGIVFQLAHVVEKTEHLQPEENGHMPDAWAVHQMKTTANFAPRHPFITWYVGGLNYQIEHHLFPDICSIHYPAISHIVKATAAKHNVPYNEYRTFGGAVASHIRMLKFLGKRPAAKLKSQALHAA